MTCVNTRDVCYLLLIVVLYIHLRWMMRPHPFSEAFSQPDRNFILSVNNNGDIVRYTFQQFRQDIREVADSLATDVQSNTHKEIKRAVDRADDLAITTTSKIYQTIHKGDASAKTMITEKVEATKAFVASNYVQAGKPLNLTATNSTPDPSCLTSDQQDLVVGNDDYARWMKIDDRRKNMCLQVKLSNT